MLDPRRLLVLDAVVAEGSMTGAATRLGYTQSAVSQAIAALEQEAGVALLERGARGVRPTSAGALLAGHAAALRARLADAEQALDDHRRGRTGRLRLLAFPSAATILFPPVIAAFRAAQPDVALELAQAEPPIAVDALRAGRADLAVVFDYAWSPVFDAAGLERHPLGGDPMLVALPPGHPAAAHERVPLAALAEETWVSSADPTCNLLLTHHAPFAPRVAFAADDYGAIGRLVLAGVGVALVPELAAPAAGDTVVLRPLDPEPTRALLALTPPSPAPAALAVLAELRSARRRSTSA